MDFSIPIFVVEYATLLIIFLLTISHPERVVRAIQMFSIATLARTMSIYYFALEPPREMVLLYDPIANIFLNTKEAYVTKDLFFSGHVAALSLLTLVTVNKYVKIWATLATMLVSIMIMWQHVHYSMDVLIAPLVAYVSYKFVLYVHRETRYGLELQEA